MKLEDLKKELPFKWRVQSTTKFGCTCVAYIDARDVQDLLDDVVGAANWQVKYEEHKGNLFASIGILTSTTIPVSSGNIQKEVWVWKSDCGTESQVEKQKGEASDAFKRAAVMWGVGRFLYSLKIIKIKEVIEKNGKFYPSSGGNQIWDINSHCNALHKKTKPTIERKPSLTIEQFDKAKKATEVQMQTVIDKFRMSTEQRETLTKLISLKNVIK
tara:strand:- start:84 stop:728 length:645 start_codon:yes stop_codon:yes gene_type:complete